MQWLLQNWGTILGIVVAVLPSLIVALTPYPKVEGFAKTVLQVLEVFSVLTHKDSPGTLKLPLTLARPPAIAALFVMLAFAGFARAQVAPVISTGPSLSLLEVRSGYTHPVQVAPGLGYQLNLGWLQTEFLGESWDLIDLSFDLYGNVLSNPNGDQATALSISALVCTLNAVFCLGVGTDLLGANGSALTGGWTAKNNLFPVLSFSIPVVWGAPTAPPIGVEQGARGLKRGGTVYMGAP